MANTTERFLAVFDASVTSMESVRAALRARNIAVVDQFDFINTLVLAGQPDLINQLPATVPGIKSVEREGTVSVPE
jgi:hypothetical protein